MGDGYLAKPRIPFFVDEVAKWWIQIPDVGRASVVPFDRIETRARLWSTTSIPLPTPDPNQHDNTTAVFFCQAAVSGTHPVPVHAPPPPLRHQFTFFLRISLEIFPGAE